MSHPTAIYTHGWFLPGPDPSTPTYVYTAGWFEQSILVAPLPITLSAVAVDAGTVELTWVHDSLLTDSFSIEKRPSNPPLIIVDFEPVVEGLGPEVREFTDEEAWSLQAFDYRVIATNIVGDTYSNIFTVTPPLPPYLPVLPPPRAQEDVRTPVLEPPVITFLSPGIYGLEGRGTWTIPR